MPIVWAKEPFIAATEDGPVNISDKEPYQTDDAIVQRFPQKFISPEKMEERGDGKRVTEIKVDNAGNRGRLK